jgi:inner membrane protein
MENQNEKKEEVGFFQSTTAKLMMVGALTIVLLLPLAFVQDLISERNQRKTEIMDEVSTIWGKDIMFYGPILKVPYKSNVSTKIINEKTGAITLQNDSKTNYAYFFPNELNNKTNVLKNEKLKRGIYSPIVFNANLNFEGNFSNLDFAKMGISEENIDWDKASIIIKTTNLKSIKSELLIQLNGQKLLFEPTNNNEEYSIISTQSFNYNALAKNQLLDFKFSINYNGSNSLKFIPIGKTTSVSIDSDWESPSFEGSFAATDATKKISNSGFHADWKILAINRTFSQQYNNTLPNLDDYLFGVKLIQTVDEYQQNERASKYGFLVIGLTFLLFYLIQTISKINIHIFQYSMIGIALILFYTLLIAITEHSSFSLAYSLSSIAVIALITSYSVSILQNKKFPVLIGSSLVVLYSFIFVIIQLEDYALLVGSIGLFFILATVMYFSRKIEW